MQRDGDPERRLAKEIDGAFDEVIPFGEERLVFLGRGLATIVSASGAACSPSRRYVAFVSVTPNWAAAPNAVYYVYDLTQTPEQNRMNNLPLVKAFKETGWAVYPAANRRRRSYQERLIPDGRYDSKPSRALRDSIHFTMSSLEWLSDDELSFLDYSHSTLQIVYVDIAHGVRTPTVIARALDTRRLVDYAKWSRNLGPESLIHGDSITRLEAGGRKITLRVELKQDPWVRVDSVGAAVRR